MHVLTLVAEGLVGSSLPEQARKWLADHGAVDMETTLLDPERAIDITFRHPEGPNRTPSSSEIRRLCAAHPVDSALQGLEARRKRLLIADMESTVIENEMLDELAEFVGARDQVAAITERAMNGELDFEAALEERVSLLTGLEEDVLRSCLDRIRIDPGAATLVATLKSHGVYTALVSGGFTFFADHVRDRLGFDESRANRLLTSDSKLTGRVGRPILDREAKVRALDELCEKLDLSPDNAVTVGDGANDLSMLKKSGLGVAYHGKPHVAEAADFRIDHGDLSTLLFFQGFPSSEWRT